MQFSLGINTLDNYISQDSQHSTDSLRTITDIAKLQSYFRERKDATFKSIDKLWKRIEQCESTCMQLSDSVDVSYSRINQDNRSLNIERYEDLLPFSFREVQWTKSSRVAVVNQNSDKVKMVEKYENCVSDFQAELQVIEKEQQRILTELQENIQKECKQHQQILTTKHKQYKQTLDQFQQNLSSIQSQLSHSHSQLQSSLQGLYKSLVNSITNKIAQIEQQVLSLNK